MWVITCFKRSPKKPLDLPYVKKKAKSIIKRSALARCNVLIKRNKNTLQTTCSATFAPFLSCSFFFYFSMTTQLEGPRHKDKDHHDNDMSTAPHHTRTTKQKRRATKQRHTHTRTCTCPCHSFCSFLMKKSGTRTFHVVYCSNPLTFHNG